MKIETVGEAMLRSYCDKVGWYWRFVRDGEDLNPCWNGPYKRESGARSAARSAALRYLKGQIVSSVQLAERS